MGHKDRVVRASERVRALPAYIKDPIRDRVRAERERDELQAECDRFAEALREIADFGDAIRVRIDNHYSDRRILKECREHAKAALDDSQQEDR